LPVAALVNSQEALFHAKGTQSPQKDSETDNGERLHRLQEERFERWPQAAEM
jgi:hypothetical protein